MQFSEGLLAPAEIKKLFAPGRTEPLKDLGQNFLITDRVVAAMIQALSLSESDNTVEIGSGLGALAVPLAHQKSPHTVIEIDPTMVHILKIRLASLGLQDGVHIISEDFLRYHGSDLPSHFKIISSVPYSITSPLFHRLIHHYFEQWDVGVFLIQKEMQEKMTSTPPRGSYWFHFLTAYYELDVVERSVPPSAFWPQPKVHSSIIRLTKKKEPLAIPSSEWSKFVHLIFSQPRKQLQKVIDATLLEQVQIDPILRAEVLTFEQLVSLYPLVKEELQGNQ